MLPLFLLIIIPQITIKSNINWHRDFGQGMFRGDFWRDWYNGEYTLVPLCIKKSQFLGQKQTPQGFCGDLFIPGGVVIFYGKRHTTKYRD